MVFETPVSLTYFVSANLRLLRRVKTQNQLFLSCLLLTHCILSVRFRAVDCQSPKNSRSKELYAVVIIALSTGMRRSEVLWLRWKQINFERGFLMLENTKNNEPRIIPLEGAVLKLFKEKWGSNIDPEALVFPSPSDPNQPVCIRSAWEHVLKISEITNFRFHDLRHSCASLLAMNGHSLLDIAQLLGHKDLQSTKRYSHLSHEYTRKMMKTLHKQIFK